MIMLMSELHEIIYVFVLVTYELFLGLYVSIYDLLCTLLKVTKTLKLVGQL